MLISCKCCTNELIIFVYNINTRLLSFFSLRTLSSVLYFAQSIQWWVGSWRWRLRLPCFRGHQWDSEDCWCCLGEKWQCPECHRLGQDRWPYQGCVVLMIPCIWWKKEKRSLLFYSNSVQSSSSRLNIINWD